jgi:hypothetical protein
MNALLDIKPRVYTDEFLQKLSGLYNNGVRLKEIARVLGYKDAGSLGVALIRCRDKGLITARNNRVVGLPRECRGMPPEQRKRIEDAAKAGMDLQEIADIEGVTFSTVKSHLYRQGIRPLAPAPLLTVVPIPEPAVEAMQSFNRGPDFSREIEVFNATFAKNHALDTTLQVLRAEAQTLEARLGKVRAAIETLQAIGETEQ